jgi:hypothetical protein
MGGNLFKLGRIPREQYLALEAEIRTYLDQKMPNAYRIPRYYGDKSDFGDMDIIVASEFVGHYWGNIRYEMVQDLGITQYKAAGSVFSTVYKNFQVDYFLAPEEHLDSMYNFLSFNDLGNLIGKIYRKFNLKYGERGLVYVYRRSSGHYRNDLHVSTDFKKICGFLQLNYEKWLSGFGNLHEMFEWIIACPYFSVEPYLNPAKTMEKRSTQRLTIERFIEYLKQHNIQKTYHFEDAKDYYLPQIARYFPEANLLEMIDSEVKQEEIADEINRKFNGKIVMELLPQLTGRELGIFIVEFKQEFENFEEYVLDTSQEEINMDIVQFYNRSEDF